MNKKLIVLSTMLAAALCQTPSFADMDELSGYFEIRDTIKLMNSELKNGISNKNSKSIFDEKEIEFKIDSFIAFMNNRVYQYSQSDSKLKYHYVKRLNNLLDETRNLYSEARPIILAKRNGEPEKISPTTKAAVEAAKEHEEGKKPSVDYVKVIHPYFDSIGLRTLASREPLNVDPNSITVNPAPKETEAGRKASQPLMTKESVEKSVGAVPAIDEQQSKTVNTASSTQKAVSESVVAATTVGADKKSSSNDSALNAPAKAVVSATVPAKPADVKPADAAKPVDVKPVDTAKPVDVKPADTAKPADVVKATDTAKLEDNAESLTSSPDVSSQTTVPMTGSFMRPMAIMVENHNQARPQSGLYKADVLYEMPVEGGITRFMGLFTTLPGLIGPVRSCREYFVDRALEVDALYVHCGGSPKGYAYLSKSKINSVDEIKNSPPFHRDNTRKAPHNLYGNGEKILKYMSQRCSMKVAKQPVPLSYGTRTVQGEAEGNYLRINYHGNYAVEIKFENGVYHRFMNKILHVDRETKKPLEASAVVLQIAAMKTVDDIGRQEISFIGSGDAYVLENGRRTKVTWHKDSPRGKTVYKDASGTEYLFAKKGQVWVQVVSPNHKTFFAPVKDEPKAANTNPKASTKKKPTKTDKATKAKADTDKKAGDDSAKAKTETAAQKKE